MEARTEAIRLLIAYAASLVDGAHASSAETKVRLEILTPIVKAWCTEIGFDVASTGVQIFGGLGYSEECEASQYFREARVHMIYEGTTGVQASDLIFRKIRLDGVPVHESSSIRSRFPSRARGQNRCRSVARSREDSRLADTAE